MPLFLVFPKWCTLPFPVIPIMLLIVAHHLHLGPCLLLSSCPHPPPPRSPSNAPSPSSDVVVAKDLPSLSRSRMSHLSPLFTTLTLALVCRCRDTTKALSRGPCPCPPSPPQLTPLLLFPSLPHLRCLLSHHLRLSLLRCHQGPIARPSPSISTTACATSIISPLASTLDTFHYTIYKGGVGHPLLYLLIPSSLR